MPPKLQQGGTSRVRFGVPPTLPTLQEDAHNNFFFRMLSFCQKGLKRCREDNPDGRDQPA